LGGRTLIKDIEELKEFIKQNKKQQDYFDQVLEKAFSKGGK
jgi:hypothetical protein